MEMAQKRQPESMYGSTREIQFEDVNVRSIDDNKMWVGRRRNSPDFSYYEPYPGRENSEHHGENERKSRPHTMWWNDNEVKRKRRVAKYKLYAAEGKIKSSLKNRFRSFKITCMKMAANRD